MDINDFRGLMTLLVIISFLGLCIWAYSAKQKKRFEDAANLPFADDEDLEPKFTRETSKDE